MVAAVRAVVPDAGIGIKGPALSFAEDIGDAQCEALSATSLDDGIRPTIELYRTNP